MNSPGRNAAISYLSSGFVKSRTLCVTIFGVVRKRREDRLDLPPIEACIPVRQRLHQLSPILKEQSDRYPELKPAQRDLR